MDESNAAADDFSAADDADGRSGNDAGQATLTMSFRETVKEAVRSYFEPLKTLTKWVAKNNVRYPLLFVLVIPLFMYLSVAGLAFVAGNTMETFDITTWPIAAIIAMLIVSVFWIFVLELSRRQQEKDK